MDRLPPEILPLIANHIDQGDLYQCVLVNHQFHATMTPFLWRSICVHSEIPVAHFFQHLANKQEPPLRTSLGQYIHHLHLELSDWIDEETSLIKGYPCFFDFILTLEQPIVDHGFQQLAHHCHQLTSLILARIRITRPTLIAFGQHLNQLTTLALLDCPRLPYDMATLVKDLPIKRLFIAPPDVISPYDWDDDDNDDDDGDDGNRVLDLTGFQHLTYLRLHGATIIHLLKFAQTQINNFNNNIHGTVFCWPHLSALTLDGSFNIQDNDLIPLLPFLPVLTHLKVTETKLTDVFLVAVIFHLPDLLEIDVSHSHGYTPHGIQRLVRGCRRLTVVVVDHCDISMDDFPEAGDHCSGPVMKGKEVSIGLHHLDQEAMHKIRLAPYLDDNDDDEQLDDDGDDPEEDHSDGTFESDMDDWDE